MTTIAEARAVLDYAEQLLAQARGEQQELIIIENRKESARLAEIALERLCCEQCEKRDHALKQRGERLPGQRVWYNEQTTREDCTVYSLYEDCRGRPIIWGVYDDPHVGPVIVRQAVNLEPGFEDLWELAENA